MNTYYKKKSLLSLIILSYLSFIVIGCGKKLTSNSNNGQTNKLEINKDKKIDNLINFTSYNDEDTFNRTQISALLNKGLTGNGINVLLLDNEFNFKCEELFGKNIQNKDFHGDYPYFQNWDDVESPILAGAPLSLEEEGHGTDMARILAGNLKNNKQGVAPNVTIFPTSAVDGGAPIVKWINKINEKKLYNIKIASNSNHVSSFHYLLNNISYPFYNEGFKDTIYVSIAGNEKNYPTLLTNNAPPLNHPIYKQIIVTVAVAVAVDKFNNLTSLSRPCANAADYCIAVPSSGPTSPTAPVVAGVLALLMEAFPDLPIEEYQKAIIDSATKIGIPSETGKGLLNANGAYEILKKKYN